MDLAEMQRRTFAQCFLAERAGNSELAKRIDELNREISLFMDDVVTRKW